MESGKVCLVMEECSLSDSMREAMAMFVHASQTKEIKMNLHIDPSCPKLILTDKVCFHQLQRRRHLNLALTWGAVLRVCMQLRLRKVLLNLLSNSMKFTPAGGSVTLSVSARRVDVVETTAVDPTTGELTTARTHVDDPAGKWDEVHVNVRDTGPGVDRRMIDRLFQPFTQGDGSFSRKAGGTGLGLAISKQLVTLLGGRIWLDSAVVEGSSFHFTIVCQNVCHTPPPSPRMVPPASLIARRRPSLGLPLPPQMDSVVVDAGRVSPSSSASFAAVPVVTPPPSTKASDGPAPLVKSATVELHRRKAEAATALTTPPDPTPAAPDSNEPKRPLILGNHILFFLFLFSFLKRIILLHIFFINCSADVACTQLRRTTRPTRS
jgi:hypothetical protein